MKQILQNLKSGETEVAEIPPPQVRRGHLLVRTSHTLISAGTERMLVDFGKAGLLNKARQQPERLRAVLDKVRTDGLMPTVQAVRNKLDQPLAMGYCNVGTVIEVGPGVTGFGVGDRVASNGKHAEIVSVPVNLCAKVPDNVQDDAAAFTVLGAVALQGIRLAAPTLGEAVVVSGLGLIGLLTVQLLRANGCRVLGTDFDPQKLAVARSSGAETVQLGEGADPVAAAQCFSRGRGVDAVIITASTKSSEPVHQAALMCRKRGRIVVVGVTGLELSRADFYEKELTFQVSCSYGPGRYDPTYEDQGVDYPFGFVRWTVQRNLQAVLDMMSAGALEVSQLVSHRFPIEVAGAAYDLIGSEEPSLGILLSYGRSSESAETLRDRTVRLSPKHGKASRPQGAPRLGFVGAGNYAGAVLIPAFKAARGELVSVASAGGVSSVHAARKFGFQEATTDTAALIADPKIDAVVISTRHDSHAQLVEGALRAGKHVFVEKPLCLTIDELDSIMSMVEMLGEGAPLLMVGFNRRFAPLVRKISSLLQSVSGPKAFVMTVNAGAIPAAHWTQEADVGGGRILGEACHFIDLLRHLAGAPIENQNILAMEAERPDTVSISLRFADGSLGMIHYLANGHKSFPKERLEIFAGGRILQLDNFRKLTGYGWPRFSRMALWNQDKGQKDCVAAFVEAIREGGPSPIPLAEIAEVARVTIEIAAHGR